MKTTFSKRYLESQPIRRLLVLERDAVNEERFEDAAMVRDAIIAAREHQLKWAGRKRMSNATRSA